MWDEDFLLSALCKRMLETQLFEIFVFSQEDRMKGSKIFISLQNFWKKISLKGSEKFKIKFKCDNSFTVIGIDIDTDTITDTVIGIDTDTMIDIDTDTDTVIDIDTDTVI